MIWERIFISLSEACLALISSYTTNQKGIKVIINQNESWVIISITPNANVSWYAIFAFDNYKLMQLISYNIWRLMTSPLYDNYNFIWILLIIF